MFIIISLLFIRDTHDFHKFCSYVLLIAGVLCFICEILIPTTKEELEKIAEIYGQKVVQSTNDVIVFNKQNEQNNKEKIGSSINDIIEKSEEKKVEIKLDNDLSSEEQNIPNLNNEIIAANNQSTNPYDLPEDFWNIVIFDGAN